MKKIILSLMIAAMPVTTFAAPAAPVSAEDNTVEAAKDDIEIRMLREVRLMRQTSEAEALISQKQLEADKAALTEEKKLLAARKTALENEVLRLQVEFEHQTKKLDDLNTEVADTEASRKTLEDAVRTAAANLRERLAVSPAASLMPGSSDLIRELISSGDYPTQEQIRQLSKLFFDEIVHGGKLTMAEGSVLLADGTPVEASILRIGALCSAARLADGTITFLLPSSGGSTLSVADSKLPSAIRSQLKEYMDGSSQFVPADFSEGDVLRRFDTRKSLINHVKDGGALAWPILGLGLLGLLLGLWRMAVLFGVKKGDPVVLKEFFTHARHGRWNEAKLLLEGKESSTPVYKLLLHMLCHWNGTTTSLEKCRDEAVLIAIGPLEKYIPFVAVVAAVAPLLGLLGTVTGMISTFDVITIFGNSDPKLLSGGISVALVTTELGLIVAIPLLLLHHFLSRRVDAIVNELEEEGAVLVARASASIQDDIKAESRA